ncbi:MAG: isoprenylcysteine carboxylmethyltransferase family protein [Candidatus Bathyarchaeota archaeon]|nr:MAG: isoprenylcysteine carboxylmethyltransferase family protein [Candidatus Bathyarchaeota archaeon]
MDEDLLFRLLFIVIYAAFFGVRIRYRVESARREPEQRHKTEGMAYKILIIAVLSYIVSIVLYMLAIPWISWSQIAMPSWLRWLGVIGATSSVLLVAWIHSTLGRQYSAELAIQKDHGLVTSGPYARTRHPMYTGLNMFSFSMAVTTSNLLVLLFAVLVIVPFPWIARMEEKVLLDTFGEDYREYMRRTGRFFPRIRQRSS